MEIILLSRRRGSLCRLRFGGLTLTLGGLLACALGGALVYATYDTGADRAARMLLEDAGEAALPSWQRELLAQRRAIAEARAQLQRDLNALALRMGTMQAHVARLDALGERLVAMAGLAEAEFDFGEPPALGGPRSAAEPEHVRFEHLLGGLNELAEALADREDKLAALEALLNDRKLEQAIRPAGKPVRAGWISSGFGRRIDPVEGTLEFHQGVDFAGRRGSEVLAVAAGVVTAAGRRPAYGNTVEINHGNGFITRYSHNEENLVSVGDRVAKGQVIARMGATGRTTGPHVHFEVERDGRIVNPLPIITAAD